MGLSQSVNVYYGYSSSFSLPLNFTSFNYQRSSNSLLLQWTTVNEISNQYFSVEKSLTGYGFASLGKVDASGSSGRYQFSDPSPENGPAFYRIKQVDQDGRFAYSSIIVVKPDKPGVSAWIYPNPVEDAAQLTVYSNKTALVKAEIIDLSGKILVSREQLAIYPGSNIVPLDTRQLAPGVYVLRTTDASHAINSTCKFIKK